MSAMLSRKAAATLILAAAACTGSRAWSQASPDLIASPVNYDWGVISTTSQATSEVFTVTNNTQYELNIISTVLSSGQNFSISNNTCSGMIEPSDTCQVAIVPNTANTGSNSDTVVLTDNNDQILSIGVHAIIELANGFGWGANNAGQAGDGQTAVSSSITAMSGGIRFTNMSAGNQTSCGLNFNGAPFCWGEGAAGQFGNGTSNSTSSVPVAVSGNYSFSQISVGSSHVCGITTSGSALCWGGNTQGELGNGNVNNYSVPVGVGGSLKFYQIAAGNQFTFGISFSGNSNGPTYCWGG